MKQLKKLTLIALAVAMVFAAAIIVLIANPVEKARTILILSDREPTDVVSVKVANASGEYEVRYDTAEGGYVFDDLPIEQVDISNFIDFMTRCGSITAIRKVGPDTGNYGLNEPQAVADIIYSDGGSLKLTIGDQEPVSKNCYIMIDGDKNVYMYPGDYAQYFLRKKTDFLNRTVTAKAAMSSPLSEIVDVTFSGKAFDYPISIEAVNSSERAQIDALSFGAVTHIVRTRGIHQLDQTYGIEILGSLLGVPAVDVEGYNLDADMLMKIGFDDPDIAAVFDRIKVDGTVENVQLLLVKNGEQEGYLATVNGTGTVYRISEPAFADIQVEKLLLRWFLTPMIQDLREIIVDDGINKVDFEIMNHGDNRISVTLDGKDYDIETFRHFFNLLTSATSAEGTYLENTNAGDEALLTVTYKYGNPKKTDDVMKLYDGSLRRHNVAVNDVIEFDMAEGYLAAVQNALSAIRSGENFDINW